MAVQTLVSEREYLAMHFEHDAEWVDGEVVERAIPTWDHSRTQNRLGRITPERFGGGLLYSGPELRVKIGNRYRVIDYCAYVGKPPAQRPTDPPLVAIEVLSPDESMAGLVDKFEEYAAWGVAHIWLVDPGHRQLYRYDRRLVPVDELSVPDLGIHITPEALFVD